jgi:hypothetical protein
VIAISHAMIARRASLSKEKSGMNARFLSRTEFRVETIHVFLAILAFSGVESLLAATPQPPQAVLAARISSVNTASCACAEPAADQEKPQLKWISLFDGKTLKGWKVVEFGADGEVAVADGKITAEMGDTLTGITYAKDDFPKIDYEIRLQAMRVDGIDFFCGLTFPVADSHCSFICGGWAGAVVGLSSIDGHDASDNETTELMNFKTGKWYSIRVRVTAKRIQAWIDDKRIVDQDIVGRKITTRSEVNLSKPVGLSAWQTKSAWRGIEYRRLTADEVKADAAENP